VKIGEENENKLRKFHLAQNKKNSLLATTLDEKNF